MHLHLTGVNRLDYILICATYRISKQGFEENGKL